MAVQFLGYWVDKTPISEYMKLPKGEFAAILAKVHSEELQQEMPKEFQKKFIKSLVEPHGYIVVEDKEEAG